MIWRLAAITLVLATAPAYGGGVEESGCFLSVSNGEGSETVPAPGLRVLDYNEDNQLWGFESDDGRQVIGVLCQRTSVIPAPGDYQVILVGVPLYLGDGDRVAALERVGGQYRLRLVRGPAFTRAERRAIDAQLKRYPLRRDAPN